MTSSVSCRRPGNCPRPPSRAWPTGQGPTVLLGHPPQPSSGRCCGTPEGELTREVRMVLDNATSIELGSTREDPDEQARAAAAYPQAGCRPEGLAEILAGAPELLRRYHDAATADPLLHILVQTCVDWARCGLARPIPEPDLLALARDALEENRPDLRPARRRNGRGAPPGPQANRGRRPGRPAPHLRLTGQVPRIRSVRLPGRCR